jgi:hypothetical protein
MSLIPTPRDAPGSRHSVRGDAGQWRERVGGGLLGVLPRLEDDDGHAGPVDGSSQYALTKPGALGTRFVLRSASAARAKTGASTRTAAPR